MSKSKVQLMGVPSIASGDTTLSTFRSRRALALLAYLISQHRAVPRAELVELLWPDKTEKQGRANLRWALSYLGGLLPNQIERTRQAIQFVYDDNCWVDVLAFETALKASDHTMLAQCVQEIKGEFMQGLFYDETPHFEHWLVGQRERWQSKLQDTLALLVDHYTMQGDFRTALTLAQRWVAIEPWEEAAHLHVMELYTRMGRIAAAKAQYERCKRMLEEELGVEPGIELQSQYQYLEEIDRRRPRQNKQSIQYKTRFIGRVAELTTLYAWLMDERIRFITLYSAKSMGKSRLLNEVAMEAVQPFVDHVIWVDASTVTAADQIPRLVLQAMDAMPAFAKLTDQRSIETHLHNVLHNQQLLLVLDGLPILDEVRKLVKEWLRIAPRLRLLVAAAEPVGAEGEQLLEVKALSADAANMLFTNVVNHQDRDQDDKTTLMDTVHIRTICTLLEANPQAIELLAQHISVAYAEVVEQLQKMAQTADTSQHLVGMYVWQQQPKLLQEQLSHLAVFADHFTLQAAAALTDITEEAIDDMLEKSLLTQTENGAGYRLHPLIRDYARVVIDDEQYMRHATRLARWAATYLADRLPQIAAGEAGAMREIDSFFSNVVQAWQWAVHEKMWRTLTKMWFPLVRFLNSSARWSEGNALFREAIDALRETAETAQDQRIKAVWSGVLYGKGTFEARLSRFGLANASLDKALEVLDQDRLDAHQAYIFLALGRLAITTTQYTRAYDMFVQGFDEAAENNADELLPIIMLHLVQIAYWQGNMNTALAWANDAAALFEQNAQWEYLSIVDFWRGYIAIGQGDYEQAGAHAIASETHGRQIKSELRVAYAHQLRASVYRANKVYEPARDLLRQAVSVINKAHRSEAVALCELAIIENERGQYKIANQLTAKAIRASQAYNDVPALIYGWIVEGLVKIEQNDMLMARALLLRGLETAVAGEIHLMSQTALIGMALLEWYEGNFTLSAQLSDVVRSLPEPNVLLLETLPPTDGEPDNKISYEQAIAHYGIDIHTAAPLVRDASLF